MPKVSIILPSYNHSKFLKKRLDTIVNQTFIDWELIIIDDCSTDGSIDILKVFKEQHKDKVAHFIVNKENSGSGYNSWSLGIKKANSEYIWIAETDDYSDSKFLEEQVRVLEKHLKVSLAFTSSNYVDANEVYLYNTDKRTEDLNVKEGECGIFSFTSFIAKMPFNTYITNGSSVVFRNLVEEDDYAFFDYKQMSDQFLWTRIIQKGDFAFVNKKLNFFRRHEASTTQKQLIQNNGNLYEEVVSYLNVFKLNYKFKDFVKHYIKHFAWKKKRHLFNMCLIAKINNVKRVKVKYYSMLFDFVLNKVFVNR